MAKIRTLIAEERETICRTSDADNTWVVTTSSPKYIRRLEKLGYKSTPVDPVYGYKEFIVRETGVSFRSSESKTRKPMSPERKAALLKGLSTSRSLLRKRSGELKS